MTSTGTKGKRRRPRQGRSRETVRAIVEAARRLIAREGRDKLQTTRVAELAGVSVGTLYEYFPDRDALVKAVESESWDDESASIVQLMTELRGGPLEVSISRIVEFAIQTIVTRGEFHGIRPADDEETIAQRRAIIEGIVKFTAEQLAPKLDHIRPANVELALTLSVEAVMTLAWLGARDHPEQVASGELGREVATMITRYLLRDERLT